MKNLYASVNLKNEILEQIFNPNINLSATKWGVFPDFAIENTKTGKILFGEIKRQDGWVEGKNQSAGRGNAHERSCKFFSPGLQKACREAGRIYDTRILPFLVIFTGDITRDPKRVREIAFWYGEFQDNYFMWRPNENGEVLVKHFDEKLRIYLD